MRSDESATQADRQTACAPACQTRTSTRQPGAKAGLREPANSAGSPKAFGEASASCARCTQIGRTCPSCVQRRRHAWSLVHKQGETLESAATIMRLAPENVRRLVDEESDRRELARFKCDSIPVELTRAAIEYALARDPYLTLGDIARWLDMCQSDFERAFLGKGKTDRRKARVNVSSASRLMIALGRAPHELPGC